jgi:hypothetical protein
MLKIQANLLGYLRTTYYAENNKTINQKQNKTKQKYAIESQYNQNLDQKSGNKKYKILRVYLLKIPLPTTNS